MARIGTRPIREPLYSLDKQPWHNYGQPPPVKTRNEISQPPTPEPEFGPVIEGDYRPWNMPQDWENYGEPPYGVVDPSWFQKVKAPGWQNYGQPPQLDQRKVINSFLPVLFYNKDTHREILGFSNWFKDLMSKK